MNIRLITHSLILVSLMAFMPVSAASADAPVFEGPFHYESSFVLTNCGSFRVIDYYVIDWTVTRFFDQAGNLDHYTVQLSGTDTVTNSETGKAYSGYVHDVYTIDLVEGTRTDMGIYWHITVPGAGAVFLDIGRVVFQGRGNIIFEAGPHQELDGDFDALCAALQ
jgi:hypothetical protein